MCSMVRRIPAAKSVGPKAPLMSRVRVAGLFGAVFTAPVTGVAAGWGRAPPSCRPRRFKEPRGREAAAGATRAARHPPAAQVTLIAPVTTAKTM